MEREVKPFSKPWKLVERAESFEVQDSASRRTLAFVYFSDDPWRCVFNPGSEPRTNASPRPHARDLHCLFDESDTHGPTPNVVMAGSSARHPSGSASASASHTPEAARLQHRPLDRAQEPQRRFCRLEDDQARALINDLVALVRDKLTMRLACTLSYDRFLQEYRAPSIPKKMKLDKRPT
jgi:hypothetical protein